MTLQQTDALGRATFHAIAPRDDVRPTPREIRWLKHIERHGPQSSQYLFELTRDTHRCKDTALRALQKLRAGGYLRLPPQQRATERAEFNPYIYDLTRKTREYLTYLGIAEPTVRPAGHWWHGYTVACVTSSIDIVAARAGVRYIPAHDILAIKEASLAIPIGRHQLIPDQLFALDYGGSFRVFALEVDRGTEPKTSAGKRKNWKRSIEQYGEVLERELYRDHYGIKSSLIVLWVFPNRSKEQKFLELVADPGSKAGLAFLVTSVPSPVFPSATSTIWTGLFDRPWTRENGQVVLISEG